MNGGNGELEIDNGLSNDAVIILALTNNPKYTLMSVYVKAESSFTATGIDDGIYYVYFMTGMDWDSNTNKFTQNLIYKRFDDTFDFTNYDWTIGLKPRVDGNAKTTYVNEGDFPTA